MLKKRKVLPVLAIFSTCIIVGTILIDCWIERTAEDFLYHKLEDVPNREVALVLGTNPLISGRYVNPYFIARMDAAASLYHSGAIKHLLLSGDNSNKVYNEPVEMKIALLEQGVPESAISLDYAGFRTLDSVVRSKQIFQQEEVILVSQAFHNERALFIARKKGINAIAYNAKTPAIHQQSKVKYREYLARVKAVLDIFILKKEPRFYGEKITLPIS